MLQPETTGIQAQRLPAQNQMEQNYVSQHDSWVFAARAFTPSSRTVLRHPVRLPDGCLRASARRRLAAPGAEYQRRRHPGDHLRSQRRCGCQRAGHRHKYRYRGCDRSHNQRHRDLLHPAVAGRHVQRRGRRQGVPEAAAGEHQRRQRLRGRLEPEAHRRRRRDHHHHHRRSADARHHRRRARRNDREPALFFAAALHERRPARSHRLPVSDAGRAGKPGQQYEPGNNRRQLGHLRRHRPDQPECELR